MEDAYIIDFLLAYATEMKLSSKTAESYFPNEVLIDPHHAYSHNRCVEKSV